ncbi:MULTISPECIES: HNH endonuclease signature motif containing protein [unclassified Arthrobacter]|uniref:HNH endonuclease n=1 Tax=unclassified Arthrobacter TaxID=235627 RepID=UPI0021588ADF|nr:MULTISPECIES: HNH endonuclease signature motif containing protein [unclassified Arthrobacter]
MLEAAERARLIDEIRLLEELKSAAAAAQARAAAAFDASTRRAQVRAGLAAEQLGRGVGAQVGLARRESPHRGNRLLGLAKILTAEMPCTLQALSVGVLSEWRATLLVRETACLSRQDRGRVDAVVAGDLAGLGALGDRALVARVRSVAYGLDPQSVVNRAAKAVEGRYVSCRPAPDTMTYLTGLLPVAQGVGVFAALSREADRLRAAGDCRGRGQIMADTLVERVTGQARAEDVRVEVQLIMTDRALLAGVLPAGVMDAVVLDAGAPDAGVPDGSEPAVLAGYGVVPAQWARDLIRGSGPDTGSGSGSSSAAVDLHGAEGTLSGWGRPRVRPDPRTEVWLRRLYAVPGSGRLVAMDSKARLVPKGLARFIAARDRVCRMPWCGAPIRHYDHVVPVREGGLTSAENVQGLCEACNQAKEAPGWTARTAQDIADHTPDGRHTVVTTTPTGHVYRSIAPSPPALE